MTANTQYRRLGQIYATAFTVPEGLVHDIAMVNAITLDYIYMHVFIYFVVHIYMHHKKSQVNSGVFGVALSLLYLYRVIIALSSVT